MGIFKSWKAVNTYVDALSRYGIDSGEVSSDLSGRVCKINCAANSGYAHSNQLDWNIQRSAALVALCILSPQQFRQFKNSSHDVSEETIRQAAACFKLGNGQAASVDLQIIFAVAASGKISHSFTLLFAKSLTENI